MKTEREIGRTRELKEEKDDGGGGRQDGNEKGARTSSPREGREERNARDCA
jgi:hypothetical protein